MKQEVDVLCEEIEELSRLLQQRDEEIVLLRETIHTLTLRLRSLEGKVCQS